GSVLQSRARMAVLRLRQPLVEARDRIGTDADRRTRAAVAMVLREVQYAVPERDLRIERQVVGEAMLPVDAKSKELDIELARLRLVEDAQDRHGRMESHGVPAAQALASAGRSNAARARATSSRVTQPSAWSLIRPIACMNAKAVVGPTKRQPSFLSSFDMATDSGETVSDRGAPGEPASGSKRQNQAASEPCRSAISQARRALLIAASILPR